MKNMFALLLLFSCFSPSIEAQQTVPISVPPSMVTAPVTINGLPSGCTWTATGGSTIVITVANCPVAPPASTITSVGVNGPASVGVSKSATFTANVQGTGTFNGAVSWTASAGSITSAGVFTAPAAAANVVITATSVQDATKFGTSKAQITVVTPPPVIAIGGTAQIGSSAGPLRGNQTNISSVCSLGGTPGAAVSPQPNPLIGALVQIIGGPSPACSNNVIYWQVKFPSGIIGWMGSDALIPITAPVSPSIAVAWIPSISDSIVGYNVYRAPSLAGQFVKITAAPIPPLPFLDTSVNVGTQYCYEVTAVGSNPPYSTMESPFSNPACAIP